MQRADYTSDCSSQEHWEVYKETSDQLNDVMIPISEAGLDKGRMYTGKSTRNNMQNMKKERTVL